MQTTGPMSNTTQRDDRPPRGRPPLLIAAGFIAAFAASIATIIYTGLLVEGPRRETAESGGAVESGFPTIQDAGANAPVVRADENGVPADGLPTVGEANEDPELTTGETGDEAEVGGARGESTR